MKKAPAYCFILIALSISACDISNSKNDDSTLIAEAFGQKLYSSEIDPYLLKDHNSSDSIYMISQYVDKWLMEQMLLNEAEKKIKNRSKINEMLRSYERSLLVQELENMYVDNEVDTIVSSAEIDTFFKYNKEDFKLQEGILRMLFIKVADTFNSDTLESFWETEDLPALNHYVGSREGIALLDIGEWYQFSLLKNLLPSDIYAKVSLKKADSYTFNSNDQHFYLKVLEIIDEKDDAPVSFVKDRIKLRIIQERIQSLLKKKKADLFNAKIKSKQIKIYGKEN